MVVGDAGATERWEAEIDDIIGGSSTSSLRILASIRETFDVAIASTAQPSAETRAFYAALQNVVRRWIPQRTSKPNATSLMLDLIAAYTPVGGFEKLLWLIDQYGSAAHVVQHPIEPRRNTDLHLRALHAAAAYFRYAPEALSPGFVHYVTVLDRHLEFSRYRPHALERLLHLHAVELEQESVGKILDDHPSALSELINATMKLHPESAVTRAMTQLYIQCRKRPLLDAFADALSALGGEMSMRSDGVWVKLPGRHLKLGFVEKEEVQAYDAAPGLLAQEVRNARRPPRDRGALRLAPQEGEPE